MTGQSEPTGVTGSAAGVPGVVLACTACQLVYQPDLSVFDSGASGCPRCGGWTWIAQLAPDVRDGEPSW